MVSYESNGQEVDENNRYSAGSCFDYMFDEFRTFYWRVKSSILGEMGVSHIFDVNEVCLYQSDSPVIDYLNKRDRRNLFIILSHTKKYEEGRHKPYLLDGAFLHGPYMFFGNKPFGQKDMIRWWYQEGIFVYTYPDRLQKRSCKYYLEKNYAQELKALFDKYTDSY